MAEKNKLDFNLYEHLPDGPLTVEVSPHCWETRPMTKADIDFLCKHKDFLEGCEEMADRHLKRDEGLSKEDWDRCPDQYTDHCHKGCYSEQVMKKGHVVEFGVRGVYVCQGCDYAFPPIDTPIDEEGYDATE